MSKNVHRIVEEHVQDMWKGGGIGILLTNNKQDIRLNVMVR